MEPRRRGADYEALKRRFSERMLEMLFAKLPQLRGRIDVQELSTPVTTQHFSWSPTRRKPGRFDHTPERFARAPGPRTPIRGVYLSGQDVALVGVAGAFTGGALRGSRSRGSERARQGHVLIATRREDLARANGPQGNDWGRFDPSGSRAIRSEQRETP